MKTPLAIINFKATSRPLRAVKYFANVKKVVGMQDSLHVGTAVNATHREIVASLLSGHHDRHVARVCRTVILSVQTPERATAAERAELAARISQAFKELFAEIGVPGVAWVHGNTKTIHGHGIFPNSDGRRTLNLTPERLRQLQGFQWTQALAPGRGKGQRKSLDVYPKSKNLAVGKLAALLLNRDGNLRPNLWERMSDTGVVKNFRRRKNGEPISFEYAGRRVRLATLKGILTNTKTMIITSKLNEQLPTQLLDSLAAVGISADDAHRVASEFQEAYALPELARDNNITQPSTGDSIV